MGSCPLLRPHRSPRSRPPGPHPGEPGPDLPRCRGPHSAAGCGGRGLAQSEESPAAQGPARAQAPPAPPTDPAWLSGGAPPSEPWCGRVQEPDGVKACGARRPVGGQAVGGRRLGLFREPQSQCLRGSVPLAARSPVEAACPRHLHLWLLSPRTGTDGLPSGLLIRAPHPSPTHGSLSALCAAFPVSCPQPQEGSSLPCVSTLKPRTEPEPTHHVSLNTLWCLGAARETHSDLAMSTVTP
ncbi:Hypothetical predicted protein [Marmota monax]|uniref:Uncharacterized protein n=1 Tax=Marmota monax TaxID=9995 RepID=A0A5E4BMV8_MARMO|nr:Hypothetical predicted protein [Marmota monax]